MNRGGDPFSDLLSLLLGGSPRNNPQEPLYEQMSPRDRVLRKSDHGCPTDRAVNLHSPTSTTDRRAMYPNEELRHRDDPVELIDAFFRHGGLSSAYGDGGSFTSHYSSTSSHTTLENGVQVTVVTRRNSDGNGGGTVTSTETYKNGVLECSSSDLVPRHIGCEPGRESQSRYESGRRRDEPNVSPPLPQPPEMVQDSGIGIIKSFVNTFWPKF